MDEFGAHFGYGFELGGLPLVDVRRQCVDSLLDLCDEREHLTTNEVYLCGGFRQGQVCPEHLWLEDHTSGTTYDTFIQRSIVVLGRVGNDNGPFQPGCEGAQFEANEIARVRIDGFTAGQLESINRHSVAANP